MENYCPNSKLPAIAKIFEKLFRKQVTLFIDEFISKKLYVFRKGYGAQHCLFAMWKKWEQTVDNSQAFEAEAAELSEALVCLSHKLLIAKLKAYRFGLKSLKLMNNSLRGIKEQ